MSDLADQIKEVAHSVSEDYLLNHQSMNDSIFQKSSSENFNHEIVKRICELANQNVYLSLFNDSSINKANIQFELADYSKISDKLQKSENDMKEYKIVPKGFKTQLAFDRAKQEAIEQSDFQQKKLAEFDELQYEKSKMTHLLHSMETIKVAAEEETKEAFGRMFNDSKLLVAQGDSIADMAKIAMRNVKDQGFDMMKIAKAYDLISSELKNNGYTVNEGLTKMSELAINKSSKLLSPSSDYVMGIEKIAAFTEICNNIKTVLRAYSSIEKTAGKTNAVEKALKPISDYAKKNPSTMLGGTMAAGFGLDLAGGYLGSHAGAKAANEAKQ